MRRRRLIFLAILAGIALVVACGTSAIGVDDCNTIEDARCRKTVSVPCPPENNPPHSGDELSYCIRSYSIACLHGLVTTAPYTKLQVSECVDAIEAVTTTKQCSVIEAPETADACAWLIPPEAGVDAGDAAADVAADAGEGG